MDRGQGHHAARARIQARRGARGSGARPRREGRQPGHVSAQRVAREDIEHESILKLLADAGYDLVAGQLEINAHCATAEEAQMLGIAAGHPVLERRLAYSDRKGRCVLLGSSRYPAGEAYTFRFQFQTGTGPSTPAR
jgi:hypothetical protein